MLGRHAVRGKIVVVTGASSGIGRAAALQLGARGAHVIGLARRADELETLREQILDEGGDASVYPVNLADLDAVDTVCAQILQDHGRVDVLVNNAGHSIRRKVTEQLERFHDYERTMQINYFAPLRLIRNLLPGMLKARKGHVINVLTWGTLVPSPRFSAYIGSKCALEGVSKALGAELNDQGIVVTTVHYPLVYTPMIKPAAKHYRHMKGISPEVAGSWIVRAIEKRPARVAPFYAVLGGAHSYAFPRVSQWMVGKLPF